MTEEAWLPATGIDEMWSLFTVHGKEGKLRLRSCARCRRVGGVPSLPTGTLRNAQDGCAAGKLIR